MIEGRCLCGDHRFALEGPFELNHHCHCSYCRKQHGSAYVSLLGVPVDGFRHVGGETIRYESSPGLHRESCARCGTALAQHIEGLPVFVPAGCLGDVEAQMLFHIFAASKASFWEILDGLPTFDTYPPGVDSEPAPAPSNPDDPAAGTRGSCLCGKVRWVVDGAPITARHCHCSRCRQGRAAAHASNLVVSTKSFRFTAGEDALRSYKVPEARYFTQTFCGTCGGKAPTVDPEREIAVIPMGNLDDPPPIGPQEHIWTADVPPWNDIYDELPQREGRPTG